MDLSLHRIGKSFDEYWGIYFNIFSPATNANRVLKKCWISNKLLFIEQNVWLNRRCWNTSNHTNATTYFISEQSNYTIVLIRLLFACTFHLQWNWSERIDLAKMRISTRNSPKINKQLEDRIDVLSAFEFLPPWQTRPHCLVLIMFTCCTIYVCGSEWRWQLDARYSYTIRMRWANDLVQRNNIPFGNVDPSTYCSAFLTNNQQTAAYSNQLN